jgi:hypothetical protein
MRRIVQQQFPLSFWPHALVQIVGIGAIVLWMQAGNFYATEMVDNFRAMHMLWGWGVPVLLWFVYAFLLTELILGKAQLFAAQLLPGHFGAFRWVAAVVAFPILYVLFVSIEAVLIAVMLGNTGQTGHVWFSSRWLQGFIGDWPMAIVLILGEVLRQWIFGKALRKWHAERQRHLKELMEDEG